MGACVLHAVRWRRPDHVEAILETRFAVLRMEAIERRDAPTLAKLVEAEQERAASRPRMLLAVVVESLMGRGSIAGALGDVPSAERALAEARALGEDVNPQVLFDLECSCALAALESGDPGPAHDLLRRCEELEEPPEARRWIKGQARRLERALKD